MNASILGNSDSQPSFSWLRRLVIVACLISGCVFSLRAMSPDVAAKVTSETSSVTELRTADILPTAADADVKLVTRNIEDIQLGQRVVGRNPLRHETQSPSEINPATWRAVRLSMIQNGVEYDLAFLRSLSWLKSNGAVVGGSIPMELQEMGLNGPARVVGVDPCPFIESDDGTGRNVVTGTMAHPGANIVYRDITGLDEPLGVTDTHPIWSETRQDFVVAGQLEIGEQFRTISGQSATLTRIHPHRGPPEMVFNLEVDGQHVYHVASSGLLVHNSCFDDLDILPDTRKTDYYDPSAEHIDHILARTFGGVDEDINKRAIEAGMNLQKGGLEGELKKYENYLISNGMEPDKARLVIQGELDALARDALPTPITNIPGVSLPIE
jgi:hypothetical protein